VLDAQTRKYIPDSHISLLAGLAAVDETKRQQAAALVDAAMHLRERGDRDGFNPPPLGEEASAGRSGTLDDQLALIEAALRLSPEYAPGWLAVRDFASSGELSLAQKRHWSSALHRLCGDRYLDFQLDILVPM